MKPRFRVPSLSLDVSQSAPSPASHVLSGQVRDKLSFPHQIGAKKKKKSCGGVCSWSGSAPDQTSRCARLARTRRRAGLVGRAESKMWSATKEAATTTAPATPKVVTLSFLVAVAALSPEVAAYPIVVEGDGELEMHETDWTFVCVTSAVIFVAALASGYLPLVFRKVSWMFRVTAVGAGLLIGAGLGMVVPNGFKLFQAAQLDHNLPKGLGGFVLTLGLVTFLGLEHSLPANRHHCAMSAEAEHASESEGRQGDGPISPAVSKDVEIEMEQSEGLRGEQEEYSSPIAKREGEIFRRRKSQLTLWMMVLHSCADGLVIGSVAATGLEDVTAVVAVAEIAHKIPASFSLGSYLMSMGWSNVGVCLGLLVFSATAPLVALLFFSLKYVISQASFQVAVAIILLFSAG